MIRKHALAFGRVQGVGFRYFVYTISKKYNLTGNVKNLDNGSVELEIQGENNQIEEVLKIIKKGNKIINVVKLDVTEMKIKEEDSFEIV